LYRVWKKEKRDYKISKKIGRLTAGSRNGMKNGAGRQWNGSAGLEGPNTAVL
jgi:hypothetical protein